ncbi:MAG: HAD family hydrolase [Deltaproteobacteria bacterium]|nr:HAD family hydrolase [Deltaproteobacteria bacterium]
MKDVKAIGFDLFNTLITADPKAVSEAVERLIKSLWKSGLSFEEVPFKKTYRRCAMDFLEKTKEDGRETHNRFWISAALQELGYPVEPDDARIATALDAYFSAFFDYCHLIPGTVDMLNELKGSYRLGLLSNFTHAPAGRGLITQLGLAPFFQVLLISGELGYRKPHAMVFQQLVKNVGVDRSRLLYVGDNIEADINGALLAGIRPVWFTWALDHKVPMLPGVPVGDEELPDADVPRVSDWEEFLALLHGT